jgi:hypothetical protein
MDVFPPPKAAGTPLYFIKYTYFIHKAESLPDNFTNQQKRLICNKSIILLAAYINCIIFSNKTDVSPPPKAAGK